MEPACPSSTSSYCSVLLLHLQLLWLWPRPGGWLLLLRFVWSQTDPPLILGPSACVLTYLHSLSQLVTTNSTSFFHIQPEANQIVPSQGPTSNPTLTPSSPTDTATKKRKLNRFRTWFLGSDGSPGPTLTPASLSGLFAQEIHHREHRQRAHPLAARRHPARNNPDAAATK